MTFYESDEKVISDFVTILLHFVTCISLLIDIQYPTINVSLGVNMKFCVLRIKIDEKFLYTDYGVYLYHLPITEYRK